MNNEELAGLLIKLAAGANKHPLDILPDIAMMMADEDRVRRQIIKEVHGELYKKRNEIPWLIEAP